MELSTNLITEIKELWATGKKVMVEVAGRLAKLREDTDAWAEYKTFPQFVEAEIGIRQSQTSKLLTIADYFLREYSPEQIGPTDYECLYLAAKLPGSVEENLARAKTLNRSELRSEREEKEPCLHEYASFCKHCWAPAP